MGIKFYLAITGESDDTLKEKIKKAESIIDANTKRPITTVERINNVIVLEADDYLGPDISDLVIEKLLEIGWTRS